MNINKDNITRKMTVIAVTAALYAVLTLGLSFMSYGQLQCRVSEVMNLLAFFNPIFAPGVILGCFIANLFSTVSPLLDTVFGVPATALALFFIVRSKNLFVASLFPVIINGVFIGLEIAISVALTPDAGLTAGTFLSTLAVSGLWVAVGEFLAVSVIGYLLFTRFIMKNQRLMDIIKNL